MSWNYRVVHRTDDINGIEIESYALHEVYYDADGRISMWSENPAKLVGFSPSELLVSLTKMRWAFAKPVIEQSELDALLEAREEAK